MKYGHRVLENLKGTNLSKDPRVQRYVGEQILRLIKDMKIKRNLKHKIILMDGHSSLKKNS